MLYRAHYEFKSIGHLPGECSSSSIQYESGVSADAILDFRRWWHNRAEACPEYFTKILAVKIYTFAPQRVQEDGYLDSDHALAICEWKYDTPFAEIFWKE